LARKLLFPEHLLLPRLWAPSSLIPTVILKDRIFYHTFHQADWRLCTGKFQLKVTCLQRTTGILSWDSWQVFLLPKLTLLVPWCRDSSIVGRDHCGHRSKSKKLEIHTFGLNSRGQ